MMALGRVSGGRYRRASPLHLEAAAPAAGSALMPRHPLHCLLESSGERLQLSVPGAHSTPIK